MLMLISMHGITQEDSEKILKEAKWQYIVPMKEFDWKCPKDDSVGNNHFAFSLLWKEVEKVAIKFLENKQDKTQREIIALETLKDPLPI